MRTTIACLLTLSVALFSASPAWAQAGRYIPMPRLPAGGGGGGAGHFIPHSLSHLDGDSLFWVIATIIGLGVLAVIGWHVGQAWGRSSRTAALKPKSAWSPGPKVWQATAPPPIQDLILQPAEVAAKAEQTRRLMEYLARTDPALDPNALRSWIATTFARVQKAWEDRDYGPVKDQLMPAILAKHESLLRTMRQNHEINRIEDLIIERLEFVYIHCPQAVDAQVVAALITFRAKVYFVDERTGAYTRGLRAPSWFQEFWSFRRQERDWLLQEIEQSHESNPLNLPNFVADLTDQQLANVQSSICL
jgi:hypothetical protein